MPARANIVGLPHDTQLITPTSQASLVAMLELDDIAVQGEGGTSPAVDEDPAFAVLEKALAKRLSRTAELWRLILASFVQGVASVHRNPDSVSLLAERVENGSPNPPSCTVEKLNPQ